jgi:replication initiation protein RepC
MIHQNFPSQDEGLSVVHCATPDPVNMAELLPVLRLCAKDLGLSPQVLRTLEVLLSFLPPQRNHHIVFASNDTLIARAGGLSERSLRRHIEALNGAGLLTRSDSANRKRFKCFNPISGQMLRFGLDLSPLFAGYETLKNIAEQADARARQLRYLKTRLRAAAARLLLQDPDHELALDCLRAARRHITAEELTSRLEQLPAVTEQPDTPQDNCRERLLSASDGQNDRHLQSLNIEHKDKDPEISLEQLCQLCPEALVYAMEPIETERDAIAHARMLAPMMGISQNLFERAIARHAPIKIAALIWQLLQQGQLVRNPLAYFYAVTLGRKSAQLAPMAWFKRAAPRELSADNSRLHLCPRTIC